MAREIYKILITIYCELSTIIGCPTGCHGHKVGQSLGEVLLVVVVDVVTAVELLSCHCHFSQGAVLKLFPHYILGNEGDAQVQFDQIDYSRVVGELAHILGS